MLDIGTVEWMDFIIQGARQMGVSVTRPQAEQFAAHALELMAWNKKFNLTSLTRARDVAVKHYLDAIAAVPLIPGGSRLLDAGSGGGFPGIPLKIMLPGLSVTLLDAKRKKINFLKHVIRALHLENADAVHARTEVLGDRAEYRGAFDVVVCRAYSEMSRFIPQTLPFLRKKGMLLAYKGRKADKEVAELAAGSAEEARWSTQTVSYRLPYLNIERSLVIVKKKADSR